MDQPPHPTQPASLETPQPKTESFPTPAHPTPRFLSKKIAIIAIILILIIFSAIGIFAVLNSQKNPQTSSSTVSTPPQPSPLPTTDPTADWKTYTNKVYSYSFKYPNELSRYLLDGENVVRIGYPGPSDIDLFTVETFTTDLDPETWWDTYGKKEYTFLFNTAFNNIAISSTTNNKYSEIKGIEVIGQRRSPGGATLSYSLILLRNSNYLYVIEDNTRDLKYETKEKPEEILSTFKFTNPTLTSSPTTYSCPATKTIDCMPIVSEDRIQQCAPAYLEWVRKNCQGVTITQ